MKNVLVLNKENFFLYWKGKKQPCGVTKESVLNYIDSSVNNGLAKIEDYHIGSNYSTLVTYQELKKRE